MFSPPPHPSPSHLGHPRAPVEGGGVAHAAPEDAARRREDRRGHPDRLESLYGNLIILSPTIF